MTAAGIERAVQLMKTDLLTHMVGEFPELQGTMGRIYADASKGKTPRLPAPSKSITCPTGGNGNLPETSVGAILGIADKIDSIVLFFRRHNPHGEPRPLSPCADSLSAL